MTYAHIDATEITRVGLPRTGTLADGRPVSGYHNLPADVLHDEGWRQVVDDGPPAHDPQMQRATRALEVQADEVHAVYTLEPLPPSLTAEPREIVADGVDVASVTYRNAAADAPDPVPFVVNGTDEPVALTDGVAVLEITTTAPGEIAVEVADLSVTVTAREG